MPTLLRAIARLSAFLLFLALGCRSPLTELRAPKGQPFTMAVPPILLEDHSRNLKYLRNLEPGEQNTLAGRKAALEAHRAYLDAALRERLLATGLPLDPASPYQLQLTLSTLGEVRVKYIVYGILSGVAWGVGTGLVTHNVRLAVGLGAYELAEESVFWIAGSSLFGRFSAPVVLEAKLLAAGQKHSLWEETYFIISGGKRLKAYPKEQQKRRTIQIQASLDRALDKLLADLATIPTIVHPPHANPGLGLPQGTSQPQALP